MFWMIVRAKARAHTARGKWPTFLKMTRAQYAQLQKETGLNVMRFLDMDIIIGD